LGIAASAAPTASEESPVVTTEELDEHGFECCVIRGEPCKGVVCMHQHNDVAFLNCTQRSEPIRRGEAAACQQWRFFEEEKRRVGGQNKGQLTLVEIT
jgi:hypothetical protein